MDRRMMIGYAAALALGPWRSARAADEAGATVIRVNIPGPNMLPMLPIELIPRLGIDRALGAQLAIRYMPSGVLALEDIVAGNGHFAGVGFSVLPSFVAKGKSVAAVASLSSGVPPYSILIRPDLAKQIRQVRDLPGKMPVTRDDVFKREHAAWHVANGQLCTQCAVDAKPRDQFDGQHGHVQSFLCLDVSIIQFPRLRVDRCPGFVSGACSTPWPKGQRRGVPDHHSAIHKVSWFG